MQECQCLQIREVCVRLSDAIEHREKVMERFADALCGGIQEMARRSYILGGKSRSERGGVLDCREKTWRGKPIRCLDAEELLELEVLLRWNLALEEGRIGALTRMGIE